MQEHLTKENLSSLWPNPKLFPSGQISVHVPAWQEQLLLCCTKITKPSQAAGRKVDMMDFFSTQLSLESGDTACVIIFAFPTLLLLCTRLNLCKTEAFTVCSSHSQPGPAAASVLVPAWWKIWLDLVWAVLCLSVNTQSSAKAQAVAAAYATQHPALLMYLSHPGFTNHFANVLATQKFNCKSHDIGWWF